MNIHDTIFDSTDRTVAECNIRRLNQCKITKWRTIFAVVGASTQTSIPVAVSSGHMGCTSRTCDLSRHDCRRSCMSHCNLAKKFSRTRLIQLQQKNNEHHFKHTFIYNCLNLWKLTAPLMRFWSVDQDRCFWLVFQNWRIWYSQWNWLIEWLLLLM